MAQINNNDEFENKIIIYENQEGNSHISVRIDGETVWLTQIQLAELFPTTKQNISLHVKNIFEERELTKEGTVKEYLTVQKEGNREIKRVMEHYNLDMIISLGYRVKSSIATRFRQWATARMICVRKPRFSLIYFESVSFLMNRPHQHSPFSDQVG
jgi:hypothetical protein